MSRAPAAQRRQTAPLPRPRSRLRQPGLAAMQGRHLAHEAQADAAAARAVGARQRIEALEHALRAKSGMPGPWSATALRSSPPSRRSAHLDRAAGAARNRAALSSRLATAWPQQEAVAAHASAGPPAAPIQRACRLRRCAARSASTASRASAAEVHRLAAAPALPVLDRRQRQQLVDHRPTAAAVCVAILARKRSRVRPPAASRFEQSRRAADRRQRALHLVRERLHVLLDVLLAVEALAHGRQRAAEVADLVAAQVRRRHARSPAVTACA